MKFVTNKYLLFLNIIVILNLKCFYLIDAAVFHLEDIAFVAELVFGIWVLYDYGLIVKQRYKWYILFVLILAFTSSFAAYMSYGQPLLLGIRPQRFWVMSLLMYFPINTLIKEKVLSERQIVRVIENIACIYIFLVMLQFVIGEKYQFMQVQKSYRYGSIRLYVTTTFLTLLYFYNVKRYIQHNYLGKKNFFIIVGTLFLYLFVTKSRVSLLTLAFCTVLMLLVDKHTLKKMSILAAGMFCVIVISITPYGMKVVNSIFDRSFESAGTKVREEGREFYLDTIFSESRSTLIGAGYMNTRWAPSVSGTRYEEKISYDDNGIIGLMFYYGLIFVIWMIIFHYKLIKDSVKMKRYDMSLLLIKGLLGLYTLFPMCYVTDISFALVCVFIENGLEVYRQKQRMIQQDFQPESLKKG